MTPELTAIYGLITVVLVFLLVMLVRDAVEQYSEFDLESQRLMRQIMNEAKKKSFNAENMIINALKRILEDVKSM